MAVSSAEGQRESGDICVVQCTEDYALIVAIDGIGHGEGAAAAAQSAARVIQSHHDQTLETLVQICHDQLRSTRGAVMSLASINLANGEMRWLGVGNVQGVVQRAGSAMGSTQEVLLLRAGVVGAQLPVVHSAVVTLNVGDVIVFATDGVQSEFVSDISAIETPQRCADRIMKQHFRGNDDALVLVIRFLGNSP